MIKVEIKRLWARLLSATAPIISLGLLPLRLARNSLSSPTTAWLFRPSFLKSPLGLAIGSTIGSSLMFGFGFEIISALVRARDEFPRPIC